MKIKRKIKIENLVYIVLIILLLIFVSCSNDSEDDFLNSDDIENPSDDTNGDDTDDDDDNEATVNYVDDIQPIMSAACTTCHGQPPTNGAPSSFVTFSQVSQRANSIFNRMNLSSGAPGAMPPSGRLPQATIDLVQEWIDAGTPEE
ncbi:MAG: hypothetical protein ED556_03605 [Winogradskyella sp.]|uniref:hypothetical protein n=1 Tax=Winogradskyella sp. TaxID=1883156 RepID=UPI000F41C6A5|nr:hypothetical protein [Winogradskyella sp.]RNC88281.1 MAG: hypothetical protein ED556_03605 [Winogradskyella sp.]